MRERRVRHYGEAKAPKPLKETFGIDRDVSDANLPIERSN
jgi:hypothetical protein